MKSVPSHRCMVSHGIDTAKVNGPFTCPRTQPFSVGSFLLLYYRLGQRSHVSSDVQLQIFHNNVYLMIRSAVRILISKRYLLLREMQQAQHRCNCASPVSQRRPPHLQLSPPALSGKDSPQAEGSGPPQPGPQRCAERSFQESHPLE